MKIAINGFGRIGRAVFKILLDKTNVEIVAVNDLVDNQTLAHLLKYDSIYGIYEKNVSANDKYLIVDGKEILALTEADPEKLPWQELGVDVVLECTGFFTKKEGAEKHLKAGAKKVLLSAPGKSDDIKTFVWGCNQQDYNKENDHIISNGSCTTNCLAPIVKVLNENFGIVKSLATTVHSYTADQNLVDAPHKDLRRARAAAMSMIPTTTGAAKAVVKVVSGMDGRIDALAIRVPTADVSVVDYVAQVTKPVTIEEVNQALEKAADKELKGILSVNHQPLVSIDFIKNPYSSIVDAEFTNVQGENLVKVLAWYDNEWGYANRLAEMAEFITR
ncbi:MAG: type I glyceraldehyde-3-phosphate dehydrogenase [Patescibacteria group bacterium]|nr:type I glyceraldehyde-3-phosphate dehydrogenase [Patescibacteria group bacterium]